MHRRIMQLPLYASLCSLPIDIPLPLDNRTSKAVVNPVESLIGFNHENWTGWTTAIESNEKNRDCAYMAYDNLLRPAAF